MAYQLDIKKLIKDIRGPKGVAALSEELLKVNNEVQRLRSTLQPEAKERLRLAKTQLNQLQRKLKTAQTELDREINRTVTLVKKYKKEAQSQFSILKQIVGKKSVAGSVRKATKRPSKAKSTKKSAPAQA